MDGRWVLSGGLASGKSVVRRLLEEAGVDTIDADRVGHGVLETGGAAYAEVAANWPRVVVRGEIDRAALAEIVFAEPDELVRLEAITHPHIFGSITTMVEDMNRPVVVEVPLLRHGLGEGWKRIVVDCRDEVRLSRAVGRGMTESDAQSRMRAQPSRAAWLAAADLVVPNHGSLIDLEATVATLVLALQAE